MKKTTILIIDDHRLLTQTWTLILNNYAGYEVTAECDNAKEAIELVASLRPDIIMLDINLPGINGIEAVPLLLQSSCSSKILGVSMHSQPAYARKMIREGAMGYICKTSPSNELFKALEMISDGKKYICGEIKEILAKQMMDEGEPKNANILSARELEIIRFIKKGFSSKQIALELFISVKTVEVHRYNVLKKLNLRNAAALVNFITTNNMDIV
ncbi:MAG TPA: response regulator transcription factor [Flavisolibacter sp.]|nr:response regulator transcription factor [Flavisolibacter sp.]